MSTPNSPILNQFTDIIELQSSFLDIKSLTEQAKTCRTFRYILSDQLKASELLYCVLNINDKRKKRILELLNSPTLGPQSIILTRTCGKVKYFSSKQRKNVPRAEFIDVSPLEAAALCGDFILVNLFKDTLPENQKYEAGLQLKALASRKDYLSTFFVLQFAYQEYLKRVQSLEFCRDLDAINNLWEQVSEAQKKLSNFGLQMFCNLIFYDKLRDFTIEPTRDICLCDGTELELDSIGLGTKFGLYRARFSAGAILGGSRVGGTESDSEMWNHICKVIQKELDDVMTALLKYSPPEESEKQNTFPNSVNWCS